MTDAPQRSEAWYEARKGRVTASSVGAILGLSPFQTRDGVLRAMVREALGAPSEFPDPVPPPVAWGTAMEATAVEQFKDETYLEVAPAPFVPYDDWLGASPDGYVDDGALLEVKCPYGLRNDPEPIFKSVADQPHYHAQMQVQLYCTERPACWFYQWTPHGSAKAFVVRDNEWLATNIPRLRQFHAEYLDALREPEEHLAPLRRVIDTPEAHKMVAEWDELAEQEERVKERKADLLAEMSVMADGDALFAGRKLTLVSREGAVSYAKALKALCPGADLGPYRGKASTYWKLS